MVISGIINARLILGGFDMNQKKLKKEIRLWAGKAYERLLNKALSELDGDFSKWRAGKESPFELSERIHQFHHGIARQLYILAGHMHGEAILLEAIEQGEIHQEELSLLLWEYVSPRIKIRRHVKTASSASG